MDTNNFGIRSGDYSEFQPTTELEKFITSTVDEHYKQHGYEGSAFYFSEGIGIMCGIVKTLEMGDDFKAFWVAITEKIDPKMKEFGLDVLKPMEHENYVILNYVKPSDPIKPNDELKQSIEELISNVYAEYQETSTAKVVVDDKKEIQVWIHSEKPYLGNKFWEFLNKTAAKVDEFLNSKGYTYQEGEWMYDYRIWYYTYNTEAGNNI